MIRPSVHDVVIGILALTTHALSLLCICDIIQGGVVVVSTNRRIRLPHSPMRFHSLILFQSTYFPAYNPTPLFYIVTPIANRGSYNCDKIKCHHNLRNSIYYL